MRPEQYLQEKGYKLRSAPGEWQTQCPFCGDTNKYGHLYVNKDHGAFFCHRCGQNGSFFTLQTLLGDRPEPATREAAAKQDVYASLVEIAQDCLIGNPDALSYLREQRGLKAETIGKYRLGWVGKDVMERLLEKWTIGDLRVAGLVTDSNYPLIWDRVLIPYFQRDRVVTVRGKVIGGNVIQAKDTSIHLFGVDNLRGHAEVFICEGEFDAMFLHQLGYPAVAVPGALNFQEHWATWFDDARRIFVVLDADDAGRRGAAKIQAILGKRTRVVEFPVPYGAKSTDVTEFFLRDRHTKEDFEQLVESVRGRRLFTFSDGIKERDELLSKQGVKLGWKDLDYAIEPGLLPGQLTVVLAKTGVGKTAFLTQVAHNLSSWTSYDKTESGPGEPVLVLSLEQTKAEFINRLARIGRLYNVGADEEEISRWYCNMRIVDENQIPPGDLPALIDEFIEEVGQPPRIMFVDYLGYWARSFKSSSKYEQVSEAVMELKRLAKDHQMAIIAPHQMSRVARHGQRVDLDTARDSGVVEETSDFVFGLYRPSDDDGEVDYLRRAEVRLEVLKSRHGNVGRQVSMLWAPYSLALVWRSRKMEVKVEKEWAMYDRQASYEDVVKMHLGLPVRL